MNRLTKILSSRSAGIFCLLFAIANRIVFATLYSLVGVDTKLQLTYAKNFLAGKGMGATKYFTSNLNTPVFDTQQVFPPGFSFAIIPFLKIFRGDEYKAVLAFDITVAIFFVIATRSLGKKAGLPDSLNNIVTLIAGCSQYFFFMSWSSTDAIGVCLLLFALIPTIDIINKNESISVLKAVASSLLFCLPFFFRYMYLPIALLLPFLILLFGFVIKSRNLKISGLKTLAAAAFFLVLFFVFSLSASGNALYVTNVGRGFFINQLTECYPFLPASFMNIDFGAQLLQNISGLDYSKVILLLRIINPVILSLLLFLLCRYINKQRRSLLFSNHSLFIIAGSFVSITILLLLAWLTLTYKELSWGYYRWTFVQDPRYFAFIYTFIPILFFVCLYYYKSYLKTLFIRIILFIGLSCFAIETIHGIYYNIKIISSHKDLSYIREADDGFRNFPSIISNIKKQNPGREIIVCSPDQFYLYTAAQLGYKAIFDYENFLQAEPRVLSKTLLIMPIQSRDVVIINNYIEKKKPRLFYTIAGTSFYIQEIDP
jgi:hypothetical protein